jgi:SAM-dependent methyltransferase
MNSPRTFDPIWEQKYAAGHAQRYPWDSVVSFVFRHAPRDKPRSQVRILEVGCGAGSNLWFAAREGFQVAGVDASESAVATARERFRKDGLECDLRAADFTRLPFQDGTFDLAIDRGALTCCDFLSAQRAIGEIHRVLVPEGKFFFNPYSDRHSSFASGTPGKDGLRLNISKGTLVDAGQLCFYGRQQVEKALSIHWNILNIQHLELTEMISPDYSIHAEWRVIVGKM